MPRPGHTEEQMIRALREAERGKKVGDLCRGMGVSPPVFYSGKRRFAGWGLTELRERRQLREENRKLKTLVADLRLDQHILPEVLSKKSGSLPPVDSWSARYGRNTSWLVYGSIFNWPGNDN